MLQIPVRRHTLENGLTVVLSHDPSVPIVAVNLWYLVGSRNESEGKTGFAHLFEHMMFQGSKNVPKGRHFELLETAGGSLNATTWFDRTNYFATVPAHELELVLWLESDRMGWLLPALNQEKLDNQRDVVRNERRQRYDNQPYGDWDERIQALVFPPDHPYHHTVIGSMEDLAAADLSDVAGFFETYYRPNNAVLTIAGDFDPERALGLVDGYFGEIPAGPPPPPVPGRTEIEPVVGATRRQRVEADVPLPRIYVAQRIPPLTDPEFDVADIASSVLADGRSSALYRRLVRERRIAKDVVAHAAPLVTGRTFLVIWATGLPGTDATELEDAMMAELDALGAVADTDVDRAIARRETQVLQQIESLDSRADLLSMNQTLFGDAERVNGEVDRLRSVTAEQVRRLAGSSLGADNRAVVVYVPEGGSS